MRTQDQRTICPLCIIVCWARCPYRHIRHVQRRSHNAICKTKEIPSNGWNVLWMRVWACSHSAKAKQYVKKAIYFNHLGGSVVLSCAYVAVQRRTPKLCVWCVESLLLPSAVHPDCREKKYTIATHHRHDTCGPFGFRLRSKLSTYSHTHIHRLGLLCLCCPAFYVHAVCTL